MNESFPNDDRTPHKSYAPAESSGWREPLRQNIRAPEYFIEEHTLEARYQFVRCAPVETTGTALKQIEKGVRNALRAFDDLRPKSEGGPKPLKFRHYMIVNLIEIWDGIGKTPSSGPNSPCTTFCELVVDAMGWPTAGLGSAMPRAIKFWRNWAEKSASEANTLARN